MDNTIKEILVNAIPGEMVVVDTFAYVDIYPLAPKVDKFTILERAEHLFINNLDTLLAKGLIIEYSDIRIYTEGTTGIAAKVKVKEDILSFHKFYHTGFVLSQIRLGVLPYEKPKIETWRKI